MSIFKKKNEKTDKSLIQNDSMVEKKSYLYRSGLWDNIPENIKKVLYISNVQPDEIKQGYGINITININTGEINSEDKLPDDPSTIYTKLLIEEANINNIDKPQYWPSYANISPEQRWVYLNWLSDITKEIDTGFVFILYYGLERQLLLGDFRNAFEIITELRKYHKNNSFQAYSLSALLYSCILKNENEYMYNLKDQLYSNKWGNIELLIKYWLNENITPEEFALLVMNDKDLNKRYIKGNEKERQIYINETYTIIKNKFKDTKLPLLDIVDISNAKKEKDIAFSNYSFPENVRFIDTPNIYKDNKLRKVVREIHKEAHDSTKSKLKEMRKNGAI